MAGENVVHAPWVKAQVERVPFTTDLVFVMRVAANNRMWSLEVPVDGETNRISEAQMAEALRRLAAAIAS